jgi:transcriptional regulator with XRE-family HTH domain
MGSSIDRKVTGLVSTLADRLEAVRAKAGLSIREAASKAQLSFGYLARLHNGKKQDPTLDALLSVAKVYGTTTDYLRDGRIDVDVWGDFSRDPLCKTAGNTYEPHRRVGMLLFYATQKYPGHLDMATIACGLDLQEETLQAMIKGTEPMHDNTLLGIHKLTGAPIEWLRLGAYAYLVPEEALGDWDELRAIIARFRDQKGNK